MTTKKTKEALVQVAENEGIGIDTVQREIEFAINEARNNTDPKIQALWKTIPCKAEFPTVEELIVHISGNIKKSY